MRTAFLSEQRVSDLAKKLLLVIVSAAAGGALFYAIKVPVLRTKVKSYRCGRSINTSKS